jgi:hypothetical protein
MQLIIAENYLKLTVLLLAPLLEALLEALLETLLETLLDSWSCSKKKYMVCVG